jgi:hypothetical protein
MPPFFPGVPTHERLRLPNALRTMAAELSDVRRQLAWYNAEQARLEGDILELLEARSVDEVVVDAPNTVAHVQVEYRTEVTRRGARPANTLSVTFKWEIEK